MAHIYCLRTYYFIYICKICFGNLSSSYLFFHVVFPRFAEHIRCERTIDFNIIIYAYLSIGERKEKESRRSWSRKFHNDSQATSSLRFILRQSCNFIENLFYRIGLIDIVAVYLTSFKSSKLIKISIFVDRNNMCRKYI